MLANRPQSNEYNANAADQQPPIHPGGIVDLDAPNVHH